MLKNLAIGGRGSIAAALLGLWSGIATAQDAPPSQTDAEAVSSSARRWICS
jgi:hypothetical protein